MNRHFKIVVSIIILGLIALLGYKLVLPMLESNNQKQTSDARATKGKIVIGVDNWIGYYPLCSKVMRKRMYRIGYQLECVDDKADYSSRMKNLKKGDIQFAVATVDSYILNGEDVNYPGTIIAVIDESKGGDAIVAWKDKIKNIDALKTTDNIKIAYTPNSPSEHLLKSVAVHFDVPKLRDKNADWRLEADGSEDALKLLQSKKSYVAVLWEPDVSRALSNKKIVKLLGTEDTNKLIVDILVVNRNYAEDNPEVVTSLLRNYFRTLKFYKSDQKELIKDIADDTNISKKKIPTLLKGVSWVNLSQNAQNWFGTTSYGSSGNEGLIDTIESTAEILVDSGDFSSSPLPNKDPYRITNSKYLIDLYESSASTGQFGQSTSSSINAEQSLEKKFTKLSKQAWKELRIIGTLKVRSIVFQSGTDNLTLAGKEQLDKAADNLKHYPKFRIIIKGHTGIRGNKSANKKLSSNRAKSVARYFKVTYGLNSNRILTKGLGGIEPLKRLPGESNRTFNYRLPRVELFLVAEDI